MDFLQRGRESYYSGEEKEDNSSRLSSFTPLSHLHPLPPSSSTTSSPTNWIPPAKAAEDQLGGSGTADPAIPAVNVEKEHMFDKVVTPSDVGKLNRLVIPKQHAERYFPLDSSTNEKGLLLNFEDRNGKAWRFRYSYWNSSQSYVMTKGWSRFVKEKRLDAGDTVSFGRGIGEVGRDRLFIDWKRRPEPQNAPTIPCLPPFHSHSLYSPMMPFARSVMPWSRLYTPSTSPAPETSLYDYQHHQNTYGYNSNNPYLYLRSVVGGPPHVGVQMQYGAVNNGHFEGYARSPPIVFDSVPVAHSTISTNSKRVRLFGVNLDCSPSHGGHVPPLAASQVRPLHPLLSLQLSLGDASPATVDMMKSPGGDNHPTSLDLDI